MKCEVCEKELTPKNESEHKGICKDCNAEILKRIEEKKTMKNDIVNTMKNEEPVYNNIEEKSYSSYSTNYNSNKKVTYPKNKVANFLKILMWIIIGIGILVFICCFLIATTDEDATISIFLCLMILPSFFIIALIIRVTAEIIQLLEDIKNK